MKLLIVLLVASTSLALPQRQAAEVLEEPLDTYPETAEEPFDESEVQTDGGFDQMPESDAEYNPGRDVFILRFRPRPILPWNFGFPRYAPETPEIPRPSHFFDFFGPPREVDIPTEDSRPSFFQTFLDLMKPSSSFGPSFDSLPANYSNTTHEIKDIDGTNVSVNQTIKKTSGDNFHHFFHFKVIRVLPDGEVIEEDTPVVAEETPEGEVLIEPLPEGTTDNVEVNPDDAGYEFLPSERENELVPVEYEEEQAYDPLDFDIMANDPDVMRREGRSSRKSDKYISWFGSDKKHDLSSDTRVNRIAASKQTFSMVEPDAEVFDLALVIREQNGENE